jgi:monoterpene epsilon-lactone hydrolase
MRPNGTPLLAALILVGFAANASQSHAAELDNRWELVAKAYATVGKILGGDKAGKVKEKLDQLKKELTHFKSQCAKLKVHVERASCHEDVRRLLSIAEFTADPDDPNRNKSFPTHIPDFISPEMREVMVNWTPGWLGKKWKGYPAPDDYGAWQSLHDWQIDPMEAAGKKLLTSMNLTTEEREIAGVRTVTIKPSKDRHPGKVLIHVHGGAFYGNTPETTFDRTAPLADLMGINVISVDYKLMPAPNWDILDQRDQVIAVFDALTGEGGQYAPTDVGIYGCSAGGGLVAMSTNAMSHRGGPLPGAVVMQSPQTDFSFNSDSTWTLRYHDPRTQVDNLIDSVWPMLGITKEKAKDPRYSTVYDNFKGRHFPPTMVQVGTKEIQMSDGIRMYGVLRSAGHKVELDAHDAMQHCFHGHWGTPEAAEAVRRVAEFFEKNLGKKIGAN